MTFPSLPNRFHGTHNSAASCDASGKGVTWPLFTKIGLEQAYLKALLLKPWTSVSVCHVIRSCTRIDGSLSNCNIILRQHAPDLLHGAEVKRVDLPGKSCGWQREPSAGFGFQATKLSVLLLNVMGIGKMASQFTNESSNLNCWNWNPSQDIHIGLKDKDAPNYRNRFPIIVVKNKRPCTNPTE